MTSYFTREAARAELSVHIQHPRPTPARRLPAPLVTTARKVNAVSCPTEKELAGSLQAALSVDMAYGEIPWEYATVAEIAATGVDPTHSISRDIDERVRQTGQPREQVVARVTEIVDRLLASRITFGRPDKPYFYVGSPPQQHITARSPFGDGAAADLSPNELEFSINEGSDSRYLFLSGADVDALIVGLLRWACRSSRPRRRQQSRPQQQR